MKGSTTVNSWYLGLWEVEKAQSQLGEPMPWALLRVSKADSRPQPKPLWLYGEFFPERPSLTTAKHIAPLAMLSKRWSVWDQHYSKRTNTMWCDRFCLLYRVLKSNPLVKPASRCKESWSFTQYLVDINFETDFQRSLVILDAGLRVMNFRVEFFGDDRIVRLTTGQKSRWWSGPLTQPLTSWSYGSIGT